MSTRVCGECRNLNDTHTARACRDRAECECWVCYRSEAVELRTRLAAAEAREAECFEFLGPIAKASGHSLLDFIKVGSHNIRELERQLADARAASAAKISQLKDALCLLRQEVIGDPQALACVDLRIIERADAALILREDISALREALLEVGYGVYRRCRGLKPDCDPEDLNHESVADEVRRVLGTDNREGR